MWEYLAVLFAGFWLGIAIFLYVSCYWVEEILDLPSVRDGIGARAGHSEPSASGAHAHLKRLVRRVVEEAAALPALAHYSQRRDPEQGSYDARTYEDLLATAILNKVIERYQTESAGGRSGGASSGIHSASASPAPSSSSVSPPHSAHTPPPLRDDDDRSDSEWELDDAPGLPPRRVPFPEFGGDIIHLSDHMGEEQDEELEELSGSDLQAADGTWEENWLFQRKKVKTLQSVPVPMLVPSSGSEYRAMIGDRDADDTTDLSDAASDEDEDGDYRCDARGALNSKTVIGGKIPTDHLRNIENSEEAAKDMQFIHSPTQDETKMIALKENEQNHFNEPQKETDGTEVQEVTADFNSSNSDSVIVVGVDSGPLTKAEFTVDEIHRTSKSNEADEDDVESATVSSTINTIVCSKENTNSLTNHQREGEYEEAIAVPVQRYADSLRRQHYPRAASPLFNGIHAEPLNTERRYEDDLIPGSIADRERKKWLNYVEMPNNPYSAEAIQKRLNSKSTSAIFDFLTTRANSEEIGLENRGVDGRSISNKKPLSPSPKILKDVLAEEVPQYKRYGRDYYINEAKRSAGGRKKGNLSETSSLSSMYKSTSLDQFDTNEFASPGLIINKFNSMEVSKQSEDGKSVHNAITIDNNPGKNTLISIEYEDDSELTLFSAIPAYIEDDPNNRLDDTDEKFEDILRLVAQEKTHPMIKSLTVEAEENLNKDHISDTGGIDESFFSSSSLEDSIKIYNVQTGEIMKKPSDTQILTQHESSSHLDNNDNVVTVDKTFEKLIAETQRSGKDETPIINTLPGKMLTNGSADTKSIEDLQNIMLPKVKDLAKKFIESENYEEPQQSKSAPRRRKFSNEYELEVVNKHDQKLAGKNIMYMHSLTARSISKEFREELKLSMATPIKIPGGANELPEGIEEITSENASPDSPVPQPGTLKNKLAFFESLNF